MILADRAIKVDWKQIKDISCYHHFVYDGDATRVAMDEHPCACEECRAGRTCPYREWRGITGTSKVARKAGSAAAGAGATASSTGTSGPISSSSDESDAEWTEG